MLQVVQFKILRPALEDSRLLVGTARLRLSKAFLEKTPKPPKVKHSVPTETFVALRIKGELFDSVA
jgi:hypothetical protein